MEASTAQQLLEQVAVGTCSVEQALLALKQAPFADLGYAKPDFHRQLRQGAAEVIYGAGKTPEQILGIAKSLQEASQETILITRMTEEAAEVVAGAYGNHFTYHTLPQVGIVGAMPEANGNGIITVAAAGTSDLYVAEEAALTAEALGNTVVRLYDVGVAGLHRLLAHAEELMQSQVIIAVAGMEGALASVIGGMVSCPVIAVPTSVGYGASLGGISALLSMLNSCASGVSVVNIDNGFGAAFQAHLINHLSAQPTSAAHEVSADGATTTTATTPEAFGVPVATPAN